MRRFISVALCATSFIALSVAANAADQVEEPVQSGFNWTGFHLGFGVGAGAAVTELGIPPLGGASFNGIGGEGVFGQFSVGYDHMLSERFMLGGFADVRYGNIGTSLGIAGLFNASINADLGFDVGLRAGYLISPQTLGYVLAGYSWQQFSLDTSIPGISADWNASGFVVGAGLETVLTGNWTLKGEYRFASYCNVNYLAPLGVPAGILNASTSTHTFLAGINYRFGAQNGGGATFETPAYDWTGFYVSGALGSGGLVHELNTSLAPISFNGIGAEGIFGEVGIGYDHDFGNFVAGIMVDGRFATTSTNLTVPGLFNASIDADWGVDVLLRAGYKFNPSTLAYVIGGYSVQHFDINLGGLGSIYDWTANGFTVGGGIEAAVSERSTIGLEYRYSQYQSEDFFGGGLLTSTPSAHTVRANYKFKLF